MVDGLHSLKERKAFNCLLQQLAIILIIKQKNPFQIL